MTFADANTWEKFPEASHKGPGPMHFRALAGQRPLRTLGTHGLAFPPPKPANKKPQTKQKQQTYKAQPYYHCLVIPCQPN